MPSQQNRGQPAECSSLGQASKNDMNEESDGQIGYSMRQMDNRDLDRFIPECEPDSLEEQIDTPQVECMDLDSAEAVELPYINDEAVPEDDLEDDERTLTKERNPERSAINVATKGRSEFDVCRTLIDSFLCELCSSGEYYTCRHTKDAVWWYAYR